VELTSSPLFSGARGKPVGWSTAL